MHPILKVCEIGRPSDSDRLQSILHLFATLNTDPPHHTTPRYATRLTTGLLLAARASHHPSSIASSSFSPSHPPHNYHSSAPKYQQSIIITMCKRATCPNDGKPTWWGCGESPSVYPHPTRSKLTKIGGHIEQVPPFLHPLS